MLSADIDFNLNDTPQSVTAFLRRARHIFAAVDQPWSLDLAKCAYLGPDAISILVASMLYARDQGVSATIILPSGNPELDAFLEFSGTRHHLTGSPVPTSAHPQNVTIPIRIQRRTSFSDPDPIIDLLRSNVVIDDETEEYLRICINEILQNVEDHADSSIGCVTSARLLKNVGEIRVAVVDRGKGIGETLRAAHPEIISTENALRLVLEGGYSAMSRRNNMGVGISNLCAIVTRQLHGELFIVSNDAYADMKHGETMTARPLRAHFPGTGVFFSVPTTPMRL